MALAVALLPLSGCSRAPGLFVLNNTASTVELLRAEGNGDRADSERIGGWFFGRAWIGSHAGRRIMWRMPGQPAQFELKIGSCRYWFALPALQTATKHDAVMQVEADHSLYFVSEEVTDASAAFPRPVQPLPAQPDGFPIEPSVNCPT